MNIWAAYIACFITGTYGFWCGIRAERRKKSDKGWAYTESWLCPNELCGFSVSANDTKTVERIREAHQKYCTKKRKVL